MGSALHGLYNDDIRSAAQADKTERNLVKDPSDIESRALLIHYYYNLQIKHVTKAFAMEQRFRHVSWFIENKPHLQFCGSAQAYIVPGDPNWESAKRLWLAAVDSSSEQMTRINACMFALNADPALGAEWFGALFPADSRDLWVLALRDLVMGSESCFQSILEAERCRPLPLNEDWRASIEPELKKHKDWERIALQDLENSSGEATRISYPITDLKTAAKVCGQSVFRFQTNSVLRFDPEMLAARFMLACWIIRHVPFSKLAASPIFMGPFEYPAIYDLYPVDNFKSVEFLFDYLAELWVMQLQLFPDDKSISRNAKKLADGWSPLFRNASRAIRSELKKTTKGTDSVKKDKGRSGTSQAE